MDCCYVGEEGAVFAAMERLEKATDHLAQEKDKKSEETGAFLNDLVMEEVLAELKEDVYKRQALGFPVGGDGRDLVGQVPEGEAVEGGMGGQHCRGDDRRLHPAGGDDRQKMCIRDRPSIPPTIRLETQIMAPIQTRAMEYHFCRCSAGMAKLLLFCSILSHP